MRIFAVVLSLALLSARAIAGDAPRLAPLETWSNVFGGKDVVLRYTAESDLDWSGNAVWVLAHEGRTLARGQFGVTIRPSEPATFDVRFAAPDVKDGVVMEIVMTVTLLESGGAVTNHMKPLQVFAVNPFALRSEWLKSLKIRLFDPQGATARAFEALDVPFDTVRSVDAVEFGKGDLLIVGEDVSFKDYRGLWSGLTSAAAAGAHVICLCPAAGEFEIAGTPPVVNEPSQLSFRKSDVITALDKRLDASSWAPAGPVARRSFVLRGERGPVVGEVADGSTGWTWMEASWVRSGGQLILCCFGIIETWDDSPAPRYLLVTMLEDAVPFMK